MNKVRSKQQIEKDILFYTKRIREAERRIRKEEAVIDIWNGLIMRAAWECGVGGIDFETGEQLTGKRNDLERA